MLCDKCKKNIASNFYTQNINGKTYRYYLCDECAKSLTNINFFLDDLLGSLLSSGNSFSKINNNINNNIICPKCGASLDDIRKNGKVGCDVCYNKFREQLLPSIKKIHANTKHTGKIPSSFSSSSLSKISDLKSALEIAIKKQEFELAAKLRDQINDLKKASDKSDE
ncbi:MAG: UvrB/UvrC motif-containing protein [Oscillospiraceae bacterium]|nr:UvrB/UvrC motif-containing protein [Oscillospiraceae bacterium]